MYLYLIVIMHLRSEASGFFRIFQNLLMLVNVFRTYNLHKLRFSAESIMFSIQRLKTNEALGYTGTQ